MAAEQTDLERDGLGQEPAFHTSKGGAGSTANRLRSIVERIERLEAEKKALSADISDIYKESKASGYEPKALRAVIRLRAMDKAEAEDLENLLDVYKHALGMA